MSLPGQVVILAGYQIPCLVSNLMAGAVNNHITDYLTSVVEVHAVLRKNFNRKTHVLMCLEPPFLSALGQKDIKVEV